MTALPRRLALLAVTSAIALLALGAGTALAHGGGGFGAKGTKGAKAAEALLADAAKRLGVTTEKLKGAIAADATARIDRAVKAGDLDEDVAADLKDDIATRPLLGMRLTTATGVARELGTTKAKLDEAFRAARKAAMLAAIDQAVKDDRLTEDEAADLEAELEDAVLPGYQGALRRGGRGHHGDRAFGFGGSGKGAFAPAGFRL